MPLLCHLAPLNFKPRLAVGLVSTKFPYGKPPACALALYPAEAVVNAAGYVRLVTRPVPGVPLVVRLLPARGQVAREKRAVVFGVAQERIKHRLYLPLRGVSPDRVGEEEVEL